MKLVSSYDGIDDTASWRIKSMNSARFAMAAALAEMRNISNDVAGLATDIEDFTAEQAEIAEVVKKLKEKAAKLEEVSKRYHHFKTELASYGDI